MRQTTEPDGHLAVRTISGEITGAWDWRLMSAGGATIAAHGGYASMRGGSWLVRRLLEVEPHFDHGLNVSTQLVMLRAIREAAER
jgi:hypothetical protein